MVVIKLSKLKDALKRLGSAVVAFSGGVDSSFLLRVASDVLPKEKILAVTAISETYSDNERRAAIKLAKQLGVRHKLIYTDEFKLGNFKNNPPDRCYYCKKELFSKLRKIADDEGLTHLLDGSNLDDLKDYRPGQKAAQEFFVKSPLKDAGLTKKDIRKLSEGLNLSTYNKPQAACLASRFPYGERMTKERLRIIDEAEAYLRRCGFRDVRVRYHKTIARIELGHDQMDLLFKNGLRKRLVKRLKDLGFVYVALDLEGYRAGSMNETLNIRHRVTKPQMNAKPRTLIPQG